MGLLISKQPVREINTKLFANDILFDDTTSETVVAIISNILSEYDPRDKMYSIPTILNLYEDNITYDIADKILLAPTNAIMIQVNSNVYADKDKVNIIKSLKDTGYKIITILNKDDEIFTIAKIVSNYIKVDINNIPDLSKANFQCKQIAYNVDSAEEYELAESAGIELYEGKYIGTSEIIRYHSKRFSNTTFLVLIKMFNDKAKLDEIRTVIASDSLMTAQVIRLANSDTYNKDKNNHITSLTNAIETIGLNNLKKWVMMLQFSRNRNVPDEALQLAYHRALFASELADKIKGISKEEAYLIGLFSTLDTTLKISLLNISIGIFKFLAFSFILSKLILLYPGSITT